MYITTAIEIVMQIKSFQDQNSSLIYISSRSPPRRRPSALLCILTILIDFFSVRLFSLICESSRRRRDISLMRLYILLPFFFFFVYRRMKNPVCDVCVFLDASIIPVGANRDWRIKVSEKREAVPSDDSR